jgi:hypothetical protein
MKRLQLLSAALLIASSAFAQNALTKKMQFVEKATKPIKTASIQKSTPIWSDDFSDPSTWVIEHDATACDLDWQIGTGLEATGSYAISTIASTTYDNGCAMIDSDLYGGEEGGSDIEDSWFTTANPIDLSNNPNVVLQFETWYRSYNSERCFIVTSTNNTDWPELTPDFDASTNPNVYEAFPGISGNSGEEMPNNPTEWKLNITPSAGGESQVWVRFHWTGTWGYAWFIDDVAIVNQPDNDIVLESAWFSNTYGVEYGRIPHNQIPDTLVMGAQVFNFGVQDQSNVSVDLSISDASGAAIISESVSNATLIADSTDYLEVNQLDQAFAEGVYTLYAVASSDNDTEAGENFDNNSYTRDFAVTKNIFSVDGIGVYDSSISDISQIGTNYGEGAIILAQYRIEEETELVGLEIAISGNTAVGGTIYPFLMTADAVLAENVDINDRVVEGDQEVEITQWHIDNNIVYAELPATTLAPGVYYACAELYNGSGDNDRVYILDDETVAQPWTASMLYSYDDQGNGNAYSNGTAAAIRLAVDDYVGIEESNNDLFSVYPNPSNGVFTVTAANADNYTLEVINVLGEVVSTKSIEGSINETLNMTNFTAGMYFVKVSNGTTQNVQRVIIK